MVDALDRRRLAVGCEVFPIAGEFRIARGAKIEARVVVVTISAGGARGEVRGWGEAVPYARYGETVEGVIAAITAMAEAVAAGLTRAELQTAMPAGAARNALDCALWDLEAKQTGQPVWSLAGLDSPPQPLITAYTLSVATPEAMAAAATAAADRPLLKLKLSGDSTDIERVRAVRAVRPSARLIVDANEGWTLDTLRRDGDAYAALGVELIEQPLPAADDAALAGLSCPVPLGADESCHGPGSLEWLRDRYQVVNIKLDKTGGLTGALALKTAAEAAGFKIMVGCMVSTSLAMAPALLVAQGAYLVDLDGPLLLATDRQPGLAYHGATVAPPEPALWG
ncbi:L-Ala-D/L-Glu epimerase [uncultured Gammaproteobacteria bacterium]